MRATRNWGAILVCVVAAVALVLSIVAGAVPDSALGAVAGFAQFLFEYFPGALAVLAGVIVFAFGTARLGSVVGDRSLARATLAVWGVLTAAAQVAFIGYLFGDGVTLARAVVVQDVCGIAAIPVGIAAAVFARRGGVLTGFSRSALFVTVALFAATEVLILSSDVAISFLWDAPRLVGLVLLGIEYWRAGASRPPRDDQPGRRPRPERKRTSWSSSAGRS